MAIFASFFFSINNELCQGGDQAPFYYSPEALEIASDWSLGGDTPRGFAEEIKAGLPHVELEDGSIKLSSTRSSVGFKKEVTVSG